MNARSTSAHGPVELVVVVEAPGPGAGPVPAVLGGPLALVFVLPARDGGDIAR